MNRQPTFMIIALLCGFALTTGCCNRQCGSYPGYAYSPTIAPPATYSLNIPSANGRVAQTPYYTPGNQNATASLPGHLVDPRRSAPTPVGSNNVNQQNGWRPVGGTNLSATPASQPFNQRLTQPSVAPGSPATTLASASTGQRVAAAPATARSVVSSIDYATTRSDERLDATRLPATDASNVRAPAGFINNGVATRLAQANVGVAPVVPNSYNQPATFARPAQPVFYSTPVVAQAPTGQQPVFRGAPVVRQSAPTVLAQSTVQATPNVSGGWTDRELTASRGGINR